MHRKEVCLQGGLHRQRCQGRVPEQGDGGVHKDCLYNGLCDSGTCMCEANFIATSDLMTCKLDTGQKCAASEQCRENAECKGAKCACKAHYYRQSDGRCGRRPPHTQGSSSLISAVLLTRSNPISSSPSFSAAMSIQSSSAGSSAS
ncbi:hypothetical protein ACOMHN_057767 [Nucella lapillus]